MASMRKHWVWVLFMAIVLLGIAFSSGIAKRSDQQLKKDLLLHVQIVADTIDQDDVTSLTFTLIDRTNPAFTRLKDWMIKIAEETGCRTLYSVIQREDGIVFGPENLTEGDPFASPPGTLYKTPPKELGLVFQTKKAIIVGRYTDEYGTFVSAFAPVISRDTGKVILVIGMDVEATDWKWNVISDVALPITLTIFLVFLLIFFINSQKIHMILKAREASLQESEDKYRQLAETAPDMILTVNLDFKITYVNKSVQKFLGDLDPIGKVLVDYTPEHLRSLQEALMQKRREGFSDTLAFEWEVAFPPGSTTSFDIHSILLKEHDKPSGVMFIARDITVRKRMDEELQERERTLETLIGNLPGFIYRCANDHDWTMQFLSDGCKDITGYDSDDFLQNKIAFNDIVHPDFQESLRQKWDVALKQRGAFEEEYPIFTAQGETRWVWERGQGIFDKAGQLLFLEGFITDITLRKLADEKIREGWERYKSLIAVSNTGAWEYHLDKQYLWCSPEYFSMLGRDVQDFDISGKPNLKETWLDLLHPDDRDLADKHFAEYLQSGSQGLYENYFRLKHLDGSWVWIWSRGRTLRDKSGSLTDKTVGTHIDITRLKSTEEALRDKDLFLKEAQILARLGGWKANPHTDFLEWTDGVYEIIEEPLDYKPSLSEGMKYYLPEYVQTLKNSMVDCLSKGTPFTVECQIITAKGKNLWAEVRGIAPYTEGERSYVLGTIQDITERKQAEAEKDVLQMQLLQAQKMESVGRLAGGVAHDFNNILQSIMGFSEMALEKVPPSERLHADIKEIFKGASHAADLTRQLLAFARKQTVSPKILDLNETISVMLKMIRRLIGEDIEMIWIPGPNLWQVKMDPIQIDQIMANLCVNARDAINGVGKVTIKTQNVVFDKAYCEYHPDFIPGDFVKLSVTDNGCGMNEEVLAHIFEPFFTTKGLGKGTGLGLAMIYGIVKQNEGFINIYSEPGKGTAFRIYLPRQGGVTEQAEIETLQEPIRHGSETVLLVEDNPSMLDIGEKMLKKLGYNVMAAATVTEALQIADEHAGEITLLMTDVIMPDMNGRELAERLLRNYPQMKCLFMSGYTSDIIAHHGILEDGIQFIEKPFSIRNLSSKLREVLGY